MSAANARAYGYPSKAKFCATPSGASLVTVPITETRRVQLTPSRQLRTTRSRSHDIVQNEQPQIHVALASAVCLTDGGLLIRPTRLSCLATTKYAQYKHYSIFLGPLPAARRPSCRSGAAASAASASPITSNRAALAASARTTTLRQVCSSMSPLIYASLKPWPAFGSNTSGTTAFGGNTGTQSGGLFGGSGGGGFGASAG